MSRKPFDKITEHVIEHVRSELEWAEECVSTSVESPIEKILGTAIMASRFCHVGSIQVSTNPLANIEPWGVALVEFQKEIGNYRADIFVTVSLGAKHAHLVVECDGHDFHERTKEQAARDRARDRDMTLAGYTVLRFTGSEIYRDPMKCADAVYQWIWARLFERDKVEVGS